LTPNPAVQIFTVNSQYVYKIDYIADIKEGDQDIVIDAYRIELIEKENQGFFLTTNFCWIFKFL